MALPPPVIFGGDIQPATPQGSSEQFGSTSSRRQDRRRDRRRQTAGACAKQRILPLQRFARSQPIQNLVSPETLEPVQRFVKRHQLIEADGADLLNCARMLLIERIHNIAYLATLIG